MASDLSLPEREVEISNSLVNRSFYKLPTPFAATFIDSRFFLLSTLIAKAYRVKYITSWQASEFERRHFLLSLSFSLEFYHSRIVHDLSLPITIQKDSSFNLSTSI